MGKKTDTPDPTESELSILQVLWRRGPSSVREVWQTLGQDTAYTTVLKLMQIMRDKRLVTRDETAMTHIYAPAVSETHTKERLVGNLMKKAFAGSASQLVLSALSAQSMTPEELREIRALLAEKERKGP